MPAPMSALPTGTRLQEFVIRSVVGEGGFGIVYLAHDTFLDREVAIKEYLPASLAARGSGTQVEVRVAAKRELFVKGMRRFVNEAHILARFRHPALVSVLRFLEAHGTAYMVMPYYRGTTLRDKVRAGYRARSSEDLLAILVPVLGGLAQIHSVDCYHLDISSDNILMLETGAPVLLDFGAARHTELGGEDPTTIILKPGFAPIEQYGGGDNTLKLGPWTDIYALSVVAYFLVSGTMPGISVARIMRDTVRPLAADFASAALPAGVLKIIDVGMAVRPQGRPRTVEVFRQALLDAAEETVLLRKAPAGGAPAAAGSVTATGTTEAKASGLSTATRSSAASRLSTTPGPSASRAGKKESPDNHAVMRWTILFLVLLVFIAAFLMVFSDKGKEF